MIINIKVNIIHNFAIQINVPKILVSIDELSIECFRNKLIGREICFYIKFHYE